MTHKQLGLNVGKYLLGFGILALVLGRNWGPAADGSPGLGEILRRPLRVEMAVLVAGLSVGSLFLTFIRWYALVRAQGLPFTLLNATRLGLVGYYFNICLPGSIGGDIIKAVSIAREQDRRTVAVATVLLDRGVGLWGLIWLVALLGSGSWLAGNAELAAHRSLQAIVWSALGLVVATSLGWGLLSVLPERRGQRFADRLAGLPRVGPALAELWRAVWLYRSRQGTMLLALALSLLIHVGNVLTFYFAVQAFEGTRADQFPSLAEHFLIVPIALVVQAFVPTPGGVGGGEFSFGGLYQMIGFASAIAVTGSLTQRLMSWVLGLGGYLVYLRMKPTLRAVEAPASVGTGPTLDQPIVHEVLPLTEE